MKRFILRWLNAPKLTALRHERAGLIDATSAARKAHGTVNPTQKRLQHVTAQILRLEAF